MFNVITNSGFFKFYKYIQIFSQFKDFAVSFLHAFSRIYMSHLWALGTKLLSSGIYILPGSPGFWPEAWERLAPEVKSTSLELIFRLQPEGCFVCLFFSLESWNYISWSITFQRWGIEVISFLSVILIMISLYSKQLTLNRCWWAI